MQASRWIEFEMIVFLDFYGLLHSGCQIHTSQATQAALQLTWWQCGLVSLPYEYELLSPLPAAGHKEKRRSIYRGCNSTNTFINTGALQRHSFSQFQITSFEHTIHDRVSIMTKVWQSNHPSIIIHQFITTIHHHTSNHCPSSIHLIRLIFSIKFDLKFYYIKQF